MNQRWSNKCGFIFLLGFFFLLSGCEGSFGSHNMTCPIHAGNRSANDILFVEIMSGEIKNRFGFLDSTETGYNKTSLGCDIELSSNTTVEWEENHKKCSAIVDTSKYIPKRREIKSFSFLYLGNGRWDVVARSDIFDDSPEVKP